jgi:hypothetical protein
MNGLGETMTEGVGEGSGLLAAMIAGLAVFAASSLSIGAMTGVSGLGLVWGVFLALIGFQLARKSFRFALLSVFVSLFVVLLRGIYLVFV